MRRIPILFVSLLFVAACGGDTNNGDNNQNNNSNASAVCGDGNLDIGEACDDGAANSDSAPDGCRTDCRDAYCGDRVTDTGEECDEGGANSDLIAGACRSNCQTAGCGDGVLDLDEACDDGNEVDGDGCSAGCDVAPFWQCTGAPSVCECTRFRSGATCESCIVRVDGSAPGAGDGESWATAFRTVQNGIDAAFEAGPGCEVWVAEGTYYVLKITVLDTISLRDGVAVYGGFDGDESQREERDPVQHETILDGHEYLSSPRSVFHVLSAVGTQDATVDGFTVTGGRAVGVAPEDSGGGLFAYGASVAVRNCVFRTNDAKKYGGAVYIFGARASISQCRFSDNQAVGLYNNSGGEGIGSSVFIGHSEASVDRSLFLRNRRTYICTGGAMASHSSIVHLSNSVMAHHDCDSFGASALSVIDSDLTLVHTTLSGNLGDSIQHTGSTITVTNAILSDAVINQIFGDPSILSINYSNVESLPVGGVGNILADPMLVAPANDDFRLQTGSPCIDTGYGDASLPTADLEGLPRVDSPNHPDGGWGNPTWYDMGAHEYQP